MGCITRTRKAQAPSTLRKTTPPPCPTETGAAGCPASAHARARARTRPTHKERVHARARTRPALKTRAHARTPRAPRGPRRCVTAPRATCDVRPLVGARPHQCAAEQGWKGDSNCQRSAERKRFENKRENHHLLDCGGENHPRPTRTSRASSALRGRHHRRDPRRRESHGAEWAQREDATRDTRTMTDDEGTRSYFTARCARCKRPPLLAGRLLAHEPAASSVRATPPRRPPARAQRRGQRRRRCGEL